MTRPVKSSNPSLPSTLIPRPGHRKKVQRRTGPVRRKGGKPRPPRSNAAQAQQAAMKHSTKLIAALLGAAINWIALHWAGWTPWVPESSPAECRGP